MSIKTADLYDAYGDTLQVAEPLFQDFGGREAFAGPIATVKVFEDNTLVRANLETAGNGYVLVVDGGGSLRCALLGDRLAQLAIDNDWAGIIVNGCIRDSQEIDYMDIGIRAIATSPARSDKRGEGLENVTVKFAGVSFVPGRYLYADADGILVSDRDLGEDGRTRLV